MFPALLHSPLASLPVSPNVFMAVIVLSACGYGVIVVFNYLSLKTKTTHRLSVVSVVLLAAGLLLAEASLGLAFERDAPLLTKTGPGMLAVGLLLAAGIVGLVAFIHCCVRRGRYRKGRKRAFASVFFSFAALVGYIGVARGLHAPRVASDPITTSEVPEIDSYGRPLATPAPATPAPATPVPIATPLPTPVPIATPKPSGLLPRVLTP